MQQLTTEKKNAIITPLKFNSLHLVQKYITWDNIPADKINIWPLKYTTHLLGCDTMQFGRLVSKFWSNPLPASSVQYEIKTAVSSSTLVSIYETIWHLTPEDTRRITILN